MRPDRRIPSRNGIRTPVVLLGVLLLTIIGISSVTFQLVRGQRSMLESAIRDSQQGALALLANQVENALLGAMQDPFLLLVNLPHATAADLKRIEAVKSAFPEVEEMLLLDARMKPVFTYPPATTRHPRPVRCVADPATSCSRRPATGSNRTHSTPSWKRSTGARCSSASACQFTARMSHRAAGC